MVVENTTEKNQKWRTYEVVSPDWLKSPVRMAPMTPEQACVNSLWSIVQAYRELAGYPDSDFRASMALLFENLRADDGSVYVTKI
jgi:hypothetical protein